MSGAGAARRRSSTSSRPPSSAPAPPRAGMTAAAPAAARRSRASASAARTRTRTGGSGFFCRRRARASTAASAAAAESTMASKASSGCASASPTSLLQQNSSVGASATRSEPRSSPGPIQRRERNPSTQSSIPPRLGTQQVACRMGGYGIVEEFEAQQGRVRRAGGQGSPRLGGGTKDDPIDENSHTARPSAGANLTCPKPRLSLRRRARPCPEHPRVCGQEHRSPELATDRNNGTLGATPCAGRRKPRRIARVSRRLTEAAAPGLSPVLSESYAVTRHAELRPLQHRHDLLHRKTLLLHGNFLGLLALSSPKTFSRGGPEFPIQLTISPEPPLVWASPKRLGPR